MPGILDSNILGHRERTIGVAQSCYEEFVQVYHKIKCKGDSKERE